MAYEQYGFNANKTKYDLSKISELEKRVNNIETSILQKAYPKGSVYFSTENKNPASILGFGTWVEITNSSTGARFLVITPTNTPSLQTGGSNMKTIAANQLPDHAHRIDSTKENITNVKRPWGNVRIIPFGKGDVSGSAPTDLKWEFVVRRGEGSETTTVEAKTNTTVSPKTGKSFNNSIEVVAQTQNSDVMVINPTQTLKIEGFTGQGIYNEAGYNAAGSVNPSNYELTQQQIDIRPAHITLYAWYRKS